MWLYDGATDIMRCDAYMCVYVCICVCMCAYVCVCACAYVSVPARARLRAHVCCVSYRSARVSGCVSYTLNVVPISHTFSSTSLPPGVPHVRGFYLNL